MENLSYVTEPFRGLDLTDLGLKDVARDFTPRWPIVLISVLVLFLTKSAVVSSWLSVKEWRKGYGSIVQFPQWDRWLGLDMAYGMANAAKTNTLLNFQAALHKTTKSRTVTYHFLGQRFVHTTEPENMKAMFATPIWSDFHVSALRRVNKATVPFAEKGVGIVDGEDWVFSRKVIKPLFTRDIYGNVDRLEKNVDNLLDLIPEDGSTFDMQLLLQRWSLDSTSESMLGESIGCLKDPAKAEVAWAMQIVLRGLRFRLMMVRFIWLFKHKAWFDAIDVVHKYFDERIDKTYAEYAVKYGNPTDAEKKLAGDAGAPGTPDRTDLLWTMIPHFGTDPVAREALRSELLILFTPNNDSTAILISNVFWAFARNPDIFAKVREEVLALGDVPFTYENLKSLRYVDACLNEAHRMFPVNVSQTRVCVKDAVLPVGGGPDQTQPIQIRAGDVLRLDKATMFRDKEFWGEDADEFKPERMIRKRLDWKFMPFSGGPRRCPAQPTVTIEAVYCIARFARKFKAIENRDANLHYTPLIRIQPVHKNGVQIAVTRA